MVSVGSFSIISISSSESSAASKIATEVTTASLSSQALAQSAHCTQKQTEIALRNGAGGHGTQHRTEFTGCEPLLFPAIYEQWLMAVNSVLSPLCEMLTLAKGTHTRGLTDTRPHRTVSQGFFW